MELTGNLITAGATLLSAITIFSVFLLRKMYYFLSNLDDLKDEFEAFYEKTGQSLSEEKQDLINLSITHRALKRQTEVHGEAEAEVLKNALKKAKRKGSILSDNRVHHLYYAAWKKLKEVENTLK